MKKLMILICFAGLFASLMPANAQRGNYSQDYELLTPTPISPSQIDIDKYIDNTRNQLEDCAAKLAAHANMQESGDFNSGSVVIPISIKTFDLLAGLTHNLISSPPSGSTSASLGDQIRQLESQMEAVRNMRMQASTQFENFDQKANQLYNILSSILKSINEMQRSTARNLMM